MAKGVLYIMKSAIDGVIKIGKSQKDNFESRMDHLENNGYRNITKLERIFAIEVEDYDEKERMLHDIFSKSRISDTECFAVNIDLVIQLLSSFDGKQIYPYGSKREVFEQATSVIESSSLPNGTYHLKAKRKGSIVEGQLKVSDGKLKLLKGAILSSTSDIQVKGYAEAREKARKKGNVLLADISCDSVSMAAAIVCGSNQNGWEKWKNEQGQKIKIYRQRNENE